MAPKRKTIKRITGTPKPANWDGELSDSPVCASTAQERRQTLDDALNGIWAAEDITLIQRIESEGRCMWVMWRRGSVPPG